MKLEPKYSLADLGTKVPFIMTFDHRRRLNLIEYMDNSERLRTLLTKKEYNEGLGFYKGLYHIGSDKIDEENLLLLGEPLQIMVSKGMFRLYNTSDIRHVTLAFNSEPVSFESVHRRKKNGYEGRDGFLTVGLYNYSSLPYDPWDDIE